MCICITDNVPIIHNWKICYIKIYGRYPVGGRICTCLPTQHLALYIYIYIYIYIYTLWIFGIALIHKTQSFGRDAKDHHHMACRLSNVSQPVKCGRFTEVPIRLSRLVSGVTVLLLKILLSSAVISKLTFKPLPIHNTSLAG